MHRPKQHRKNTTRRTHRNTVIAHTPKASAEGGGGEGVGPLDAAAGESRAAAEDDAAGGSVLLEIEDTIFTSADDSTRISDSFASWISAKAHIRKNTRSGR